MSTSNKDVFTGGVFQFRVGEDDKTFIVHSALLTKSSPAFSAMMTNSLKESQEGIAHLEDIDHDTFARFVEFLYGCDYNPAQAQIVSECLDETENTGSTVRASHHSEYSFAEEQVPKEPSWEDSWGYSSMKGKKMMKMKMKMKKKDGEIWNDSPPRALSPEPPSPKILIPSIHNVVSVFKVPEHDSQPFPEVNVFAAIKSADGKYDFSEVRSHVEIYIFAEKYQIRNLQSVTLQKLKTTLMTTNFHTERMNELVDILAMAYSNTPGLNGKEPLRKLLIDFAACHFKKLSAVPDFQFFIKDQSECAADLSRKVAQWL